MSRIPTGTMSYTQMDPGNATSLHGLLVDLVAILSLAPFHMITIDYVDQHSTLSFPKDQLPPLSQSSRLLSTSCVQQWDDISMAGNQ